MSAPPPPPDNQNDNQDEVDLAGYQELELEELLSMPVAVWSATKTVTKVEEAPAVVTVISGEDLRRWGYRSLAEALRRMVGFYVVDDHILPNLAVRGVSGGLNSESGLIKVMIDGQPTSFRSTAGNWLGPEFLPLSAIERIEIVRGPCSALFGADAFLGVVNVTTRSPSRLAGADLSITAARPSINGTWGFSPDLSVGTRRGPVEVMASFRADHIDYTGVVLPNTSPAPVIPAYKFDSREATGFDLRSQVAYAKATYHFSRESRVTLSGLYSAIDRVAEFSPTIQLSHGIDTEGRFNETRVALQQFNTGLKFETSLRRNLQLNLDLTYFQGGPTAGDRVEVGSNLFWVRRKFGYRGTDSTLQVSWRQGPKLSLVGGVGLVFDREELPVTERVLKGRTGTLDAGTAIPVEQPRRKNLVNPGVYLQAMWTPIERYLRLTAGVRVDQHNIYGRQLSTRVVGVSELRPGTFAKIIYGSSFKAPSPFLLYATPYYTGGIIGNPQLEPQFVHTAEALVSHQHKYFSFNTGLVYNVVRDQAEFTQQGFNKVARNVANATSLSWETSLDARYRDQVGGYLRTELLRARRSTGQEGYVENLVGTNNVIYPSFIGRLGLMGQIPKLPLRASAEVMVAGERHASDTNVLERGAPYALGRIVLVRGTLSSVGLRFFRLHETVLSVSAQNLFRAKGPDPGFSGIDYPLAPQTFFFQLKQRL